MGALRECIETARSQPFEWGELDCLGFAHEALEAQGAQGFPLEWRSGYSDAMGAARVYRRIRATSEHADIIEAIDAIHERLETLHPRDGDLCARAARGSLGWSFGVHFGGSNWFMDHGGAIGCAPLVGDLYWRPAA